MSEPDRVTSGSVVFGSATTAAGERSAAFASSSGIVQTGDRSRAVQFAGPPVPLGPPSQMPVPAGGLVGLPKPPARTFVGREEDLAELDGLVAAGAGVVAQAVHGLGGVGKSELALQFAHARRDQFTVVWWVLADDPAAIESGLAELAFRLHPDAKVVATDEQAAVWAVGWLQSHPGWLLVLDNVEHRADVERLLGELAGGHVLITTRRDVGWEDITDGCLRLEVLSPDAAVMLLQRLSGQDDPALAAVLAGSWAACRWPCSRPARICGRPAPRWRHTWHSCARTRLAYCGQSRPTRTPNAR